MKNKLLLTTALIGSMSLVGVAQSEIKIGGSIEQTFASTSNKTTEADSGITSGRGFGNETNLNITGGQKLSNGMSADLRMNFEFDTTVVKEVSMQITGENTFFVIANDFTQGLSSISAPRVGDHPSTIAGSAHASGAASYTDGYIENNQDDHAAIGFKVAGGNVVAIYAPNSALSSGDSSSTSGMASGSGYELTYLGSPVPGLRVGLGYAEKSPSDNTPAIKDIEAKKFMASYNFGKANIGVEYSDKDMNTTAAGNTPATSDLESMSYGATFNLADNLSVGLGYVESEDKDAGQDNPDQEIKLITVGYNWNGLGLELSYADIENIGNERGTDAKVFQARTVVAF